jgi:hypothetical protein
MKKIINWISKYKDIILRCIFCIPILLSIIVSISHCTQFFSIANPPSWAWFLSISVEVAAFCSLFALIIGKPGFHIIAPFLIITAVQIIGNIFFCFAIIDSGSALFDIWEKFVKVIFGVDDWDTDKSKVYLAILEGSIVPMLSLFSLHLISKFEIREENKITTLNVEEESSIELPVGEEIKEEPIIIEQPKEEVIEIPKIKSYEEKKVEQELHPISKTEDKIVGKKSDGQPIIQREQSFYEDMGKQKLVSPRPKITTKRKGS